MFRGPCILELDRLRVSDFKAGLEEVETKKQHPSGFSRFVRSITGGSLQPYISIASSVLTGNKGTGADHTIKQVVSPVATSSVGAELAWEGKNLTTKLVVNNPNRLAQSMFRVQILDAGLTNSLLGSGVFRIDISQDDVKKSSGPGGLLAPRVKIGVTCTLENGGALAGTFTARATLTWNTIRRASSMKLRKGKKR